MDIHLNTNKINEVDLEKNKIIKIGEDKKIKTIRSASTVDTSDDKERKYGILF